MDGLTVNFVMVHPLALDMDANITLRIMTESMRFLS